MPPMHHDQGIMPPMHHDQGIMPPMGHYPHPDGQIGVQPPIGWNNNQSINPAY